MKAMLSVIATQHTQTELDGSDWHAAGGARDTCNCQYYRAVSQLTSRMRGYINRR